MCKKLAIDVLEHVLSHPHKRGQPCRTWETIIVSLDMCQQDSICWPVRIMQSYMWVECCKNLSVDLNVCALDDLFRPSHAFAPDSPSSEGSLQKILDGPDGDLPEAQDQRPAPRTQGLPVSLARAAD